MLHSIVRRGAGLLAGLALAAALAGCSESPTESGRLLRITTDRTEYRAGERGIVTLTNVSDEPVYHNLCDVELQRLAPTGWIVVTPPPVDENFYCPDPPYTLRPRDSVYGGFVLRPDLLEGIYRARFPSIGLTKREPYSPHTTEPFRVVSATQ